MTSRSALLVGAIALPLLTLGLWWSGRPTTCSADRRADLLLGGGVPVCLGAPASQLGAYQDRVRPDDSTDDQWLDEPDRQYWYGMGGGVDLVIRYVGRHVRVACVSAKRGHTVAVDSIAAASRAALGGIWARTDTVSFGNQLTMWQRSDGLRLTTSADGSLCALPESHRPHGGAI